MKAIPRRDLPLNQCWLYAIDLVRDLARRLSTRTMVVTEAMLRDAAGGGGYRIFEIETNGKRRGVQEPKELLQRLHRRIAELLRRVACPEYLHSGIRGRSYLTNAFSHDISVPIIKLDIRKFYPSTCKPAIYKFFHETMHCRRDVAGLLADLLTYHHHLPTGSGASQVIAYWVFRQLFDEISLLARANDLVMTCYVDDITISGPSAGKRVLREAQLIISRYGLRSHKAKAFAAMEPKVVTGVCITPAGRKVPNALLLAIKRGYQGMDLGDEAAKRKAAKSLLGRLQAAGQIEPIYMDRAREFGSWYRDLLHPR